MKQIDIHLSVMFFDKDCFYPHFLTEKYFHFSKFPQNNFVDIKLPTKFFVFVPRLIASKAVSNRYHCITPCRLFCSSYEAPVKKKSFLNRAINIRVFKICPVPFNIADGNLIYSPIRSCHSIMQKDIICNYGEIGSSLCRTALCDVTDVTRPLHTQAYNIRLHYELKQNYDSARLQNILQLPTMFSHYT